MSTPEFTFLQVTRVLSPLELVLAGCSLCASYRLDIKTGAIKQVEPLSSRERIARFLESARGVHGVHAARRVLPYLADGAESPQEVNLFLTMSLPHAMGGADIQGLRLNYEIRPNVENKDVLDRATR